MQTIFVATDTHDLLVRAFREPPVRDNIGSFIQRGGALRLLDCTDAPPPGEFREYRLVPVDGLPDLPVPDVAKAQDAVIAQQRAEIVELKNSVLCLQHRSVMDAGLIAELEKQLADSNARLENLAPPNAPRTGAEQLAERSPGMMPEVVQVLLDYVDSVNASAQLDRFAKSVREYYAPPAGHEWQPVDEQHPITAADVGRQMCFGQTKVTHVYRDGGAYKIDEENRYILRPVAPPFVFTGEPGRYSTSNGEIWEIGTLNSMLVAVVVGGDGAPFYVNYAGTFPGGRITGRVG